MSQNSLLAKNKKAYFDYEVIEKYETGVVLTGSEVKSIKEGRVQLKGSFATISRDSKGRPHLLTENLHVSQYNHSTDPHFDPLRRRELLLKKKELDNLAGLSLQKGFTLIPLEIYLLRHHIKVLLGVCRGKKLHDKRLVLKKRAVTKEIDQGLKKFSR